MHPFKVILPRFHPSDLDNAKALAIANDYGFAYSYLNEILASLNFYRINFKDEWLLRKELPMFVRSSNTSYPVLAGIMLPLVMFWGESTGYMPLNDFEATENGELPQYGTCSAFVVKCFKITGKNNQVIP